MGHTVAAVFAALGVAAGAEAVAQARQPDAVWDAGRHGRCDDPNQIFRWEQADLRYGCYPRPNAGATNANVTSRRIVTNGRFCDRALLNDTRSAFYLTAQVQGGGANVMIYVNGNLVANGGGARDGGGAVGFAAAVVAPGETAWVGADNASCNLSVTMLGQGWPTVFDSIVSATPTGPCGDLRLAVESMCRPLNNGMPRFGTGTVIGTMWTRTVQIGSYPVTQTWASGKTTSAVAACYGTVVADWTDSGEGCESGGGGFLP